MISYSVKSTCALAAIVALGASDGVGQVPPASLGTHVMACDDGIETGVEVTGSPAASQAMKTLVDGKLARNILTSATDLRNALGAMGGRGPTFRARIEQIRRSGFANGLAGISVRSFLDAAEHTLDQGGRFQHPVSFTTTGKVEAYFYDAGPALDCLRVRMVTTARRANGMERKLAYRWTVFGDFRVAQRMPNTDPASDPDNVFPTANAVPISAAMAKTFDHKLWSQGAMFRVTKVDRKIGNGAFVTLTTNHPLYQTTGESCVDMMFVNPPPQLFRSRRNISARRVGSHMHKSKKA